MRAHCWAPYLRVWTSLRWTWAPGVQTGSWGCSGWLGSTWPPWRRLRWQDTLKWQPTRRVVLRVGGDKHAGMRGKRSQGQRTRRNQAESFLTWQRRLDYGAICGILLLLLLAAPDAFTRRWFWIVCLARERGEEGKTEAEAEADGDGARAIQNLFAFSLNIFKKCSQYLITNILRRSFTNLPVRFSRFLTTKL